ncbi:MAG: hypothetical protein IPM52_10330 [Bacteroidetes bacterium]|nr:hypothetical protein [Bacteroidota bacterium]
MPPWLRPSQQQNTYFGLQFNSLQTDATQLTSSQPICLPLGSMTELIVHVPRITQRLIYAFDLVLGRLLGLKHNLVTDAGIAEQSAQPVLVYGDKPLGNHLFQKAAPLLFSREIHMQDLQPFALEDVKGVFPVFHPGSALPFDPFAAAFYIVSRFEEYLPLTAITHLFFMNRNAGKPSV